MTCRCPVHGPQLCALTSPDARLVAPRGDASDLLLVRLMLDGRYHQGVTLSRQFAQQHGIASDVLDYETVFVESEWYELLDAMCYACFTERWPEIIERAREV